ncbi:MAG TPA: DUF2075 domain-containing protein [Anaerolineae bacterium]|nr:DUF2075 domain-containing protein [Anaerolineae bacterium]
MPAYYANNIHSFLKQNPNNIVGILTAKSSDSGFYQQKHSQTDSWFIEIDVLQNALRELSANIDISNWHILLEYPIPRRGKRVDVILLAQDIILVLEFKSGSSQYTTTDCAQAEDYCLDLRDFHLESHKRIIVPFLVATNAKKHHHPISNQDDFVKPIYQTNKYQLPTALQVAFQTYTRPHQSAISPDKWNNSSYEPTPTIIEAAQTLYAGKNVIEISRSHAEEGNLTLTTSAVLNAIEQAKQNNQKLICFITGVPGAGKTLAGLNIVHNHDLHEDTLGVFLSGNRPLVKVLSEALARDYKNREDIKISEARREVSTFIQGVHHFLDEYFTVPTKIPPDKVVIFDEAQRAWNAEHSNRKFKRNYSEPEMMLSIMDRHPGWAVIVALIGGGQEINNGEAGLPEWGKTITNKFPHWHIMVSPELKHGHHSTGGQALFKQVPNNVIIQENDHLHLKVSIRSYKAEKVSDFFFNLLSIAPDKAKLILENELQEYPIYFSRSLATTKNWLKQQQRGTRRIGIVASSGARRLKAYGLNVQNDLSVEQWFLNPPSDVRSSYYLEDPATEFAVQGLELDWTAVCWGGDLRFINDSWTYKRFSGTKWQDVHKKTRKAYMLNKYRVLLTRAREGLIVWVPPGDIKDQTRLPQFYDGTANYLKQCGIPEIN